MIEFKNFSFKYNNSEIIFDNVNCTFKTSRITMLLGANGIGKTTLIKCIMKQLKPTSGCIEFDGQDISKFSVKDFAHIVAYVPQYIRNDTDYNVTDYITFGRTPYINLIRSPRKEDYQLTEEYMERIGISYLAEKKVNSVSGGERQLISIARALVQQTPIIVMDEPMSALDFQNQAILLDFIALLSNDLGKTVLLSSHNPNHALTLSSDVCIIDKKKNIIVGSSKELLSDKNLIESSFGSRVEYNEVDNRGFVFFK